MEHNRKYSQNCVHLWITSFNSQIDQLLEFATYLSKDEIHRSEQFAFKHLRDQFIICRGYLRKILSEFLTITPSQVEFSYSSYGKPEVSFSTEIPIYFNISHSGAFFVIAVSNSFQLGVDIEYCNSHTEIFKIAQEILTSDELAKLSSLPPNERIQAFFERWTIKEAFIKAIGKGFSFDPRMIEIDDGSNTFISVIKDKEVNSQNWFFSRHSFEQNYALALVTPYFRPKLFFHPGSYQSLSGL